MNLIDSFILGRFGKDIPEKSSFACCKVTLREFEESIKVNCDDNNNKKNKYPNKGNENPKMIHKQDKQCESKSNNIGETRLRTRNLRGALKEIKNSPIKSMKIHDKIHSKISPSVVKTPAELAIKPEIIKLGKSLTESKEIKCLRKRTSSLPLLYERDDKMETSRSACKRSCTKNIFYGETRIRKNISYQQEEIHKDFEGSNEKSNHSKLILNRTISKFKQIKPTKIVNKEKNTEDYIHKSGQNKLNSSEKNKKLSSKQVKKTKPASFNDTPESTNKCGQNKLKSTEKNQKLLSSKQAKLTIQATCIEAPEPINKNKKVITAKRGTLKYLKQREVFLQNKSFEEETDDVFSTSFGEKLCKKPLYDLLECDLNDTLAIKTPKGKHENGGNSAMTPRTALLSEWGNNIITPSSLPISPRPARTEQKQGALEVLYHHLKNQPSKTRRRKTNPAICTSSPKNFRSKKKIVQELPFLPDIQEKDLEDSFDDYFNESM